MSHLADDEDFGGAQLRDAESMRQSEKDKAIGHVKRMREVSRVLERLSAEQASKMTRLLSEVGEHMKLSETDIEQVTAALSMAYWQRKMSGGQGSIVRYLEAVNLPLASSSSVEVNSGVVPPISEAPRDSFGGINTHGDPYVFLMDHYGRWLQPGRKCLDRPTLMEYDAKLLKALQQRYTRDNNSMPPLSEVFPGKTEARENRMKFMRSKEAA